MKTAPARSGGTTDLGQEAAIIVALKQHAEQDGEVALDEISDLRRFASDAANRVAEVVTPAPPVEIATEANGDWGEERDQATIEPHPATTSELALSGLYAVEGWTRTPPRDDTMAPLRLASVPNAEAYGGLGPALPDTPLVPGARPVEASPYENEHEVAVADSSEVTRLCEFADQGEVRAAEECSGERNEDEDSAAATESADEAEQSAAESALCVAESAAAIPVDSQKPAAERGMSGIEVLADSVSEDAAGDAEHTDEPVWTRPRPSKPAQHRDRRGQRRAPLPQPAPSVERPSPAGATLRTPAEAKLRLMLHPIRRAAALFAVLARPAGYPDRITLLLGGDTEIGAYSEAQYDDVDLEWTANLLSGEVRLDCNEGYQWLRSGRRIHIFSGVADEPGLISVGSAALTSPSTIICLSEDAAAVCLAAQACGSSALVSHDHWSGIPSGWVILSGYRPIHAAIAALAPGLTALDPGVGSEIGLSGGLQVRSASFAEGSPPRIEIVPFPSGAVVTIDGKPAALDENGAWRADGWDLPGDHLIDVVPGPSATYRILEDPWSKDGWETWDAHPERFGALPHAPWAMAQICGAAVSGPGGEYVVAAEAMPSVVCLGLRRGAVALRARPDVPVAVGLLSAPPAFLISASGQRRRQGRISWLNPAVPGLLARKIDAEWVAAVRSAASRGLSLEGADASAEDAWRRARERARRHRKLRS